MSRGGFEFAFSHKVQLSYRFAPEGLIRREWSISTNHPIDGTLVMDPRKSHAIHQSEPKLHHIVPDYIPIRLSHNATAPSRSQLVPPRGLSTPGMLDDVNPSGEDEISHEHRTRSLCTALATPYMGLDTTHRGYQTTSLLREDTSASEDDEASDYFECHTLASETAPSTLPGGDECTTPRQEHVSLSAEGQLSHYLPQRRRRPPSQGLCVLSLDGGGVRGTISLLVLKSLLRHLQPEGDIFPYLYFDVICGTSTGGLIAILLGVLHLDIDTVLMLYQKLSKKIFRKGYSRVRYLVKDAGYDRKPLERAINKILKEYGKGRTLMEDPVRDRGCYCFVTTTHCVGQRRDVLPIRSYRVSGEQSIPHDYAWTILDAALATSAAPGYFDRYYINMHEQPFGFEDAGAYGMNNPTILALEECRKLDGGARNRNGNALFISLGTGSCAASIEPSSGFFGLFRNKTTTLRASLRRMTDVDCVDNRMQKEAKGPNISYRRLAPPLPGRIGLGDWDKIPAMQATALEYCSRHQRHFRRCAAQLGQLQRTEKRQAPV